MEKSLAVALFDDAAKLFVQHHTGSIEHGRIDKIWKGFSEFVRSGRARRQGQGVYLAGGSFKIHFVLCQTVWIVVVALNLSSSWVTVGTLGNTIDLVLAACDGKVTTKRLEKQFSEVYLGLLKILGTQCDPLDIVKPGILLSTRDQQIGSSVSPSPKLVSGGVTGINTESGVVQGSLSRGGLDESIRLQIWIKKLHAEIQIASQTASLLQQEQETDLPVKACLPFVESMNLKAPGQNGKKPPKKAMKEAKKTLKKREKEILQRGFEEDFGDSFEIEEPPENEEDQDEDLFESFASQNINDAFANRNYACRGEENSSFEASFEARPANFHNQEIDLFDSALFDPFQDGSENGVNHLSDHDGENHKGNDESGHFKSSTLFDPYGQSDPFVASDPFQGSDPFETSATSEVFGTSSDPFEASHPFESTHPVEASDLFDFGVSDPFEASGQLVSVEEIVLEPKNGTDEGKPKQATIADSLNGLGEKFETAQDDENDVSTLKLIVENTNINLGELTEVTKNSSCGLDGEFGQSPYLHTMSPFQNMNGQSLGRIVKIEEQCLFRVDGASNIPTESLVRGKLYLAAAFDRDRALNSNLVLNEFPRDRKARKMLRIQVDATYGTLKQGEFSSTISLNEAALQDCFKNVALYWTNPGWIADQSRTVSLIVNGERIDNKRFGISVKSYTALDDSCQIKNLVLDVQISTEYSILSPPQEAQLEDHERRKVQWKMEERILSPSSFQKMTFDTLLCCQKELENSHELVVDISLRFTLCTNSGTCLTISTQSGFGAVVESRSEVVVMAKDCRVKV